MSRFTLSSILKNSVYWSSRAGVRLQFFFLIIILWLASLWLKNEYGQEDSNLWLVMNAFMLLVQWIILGLILLSLISVFITWLLFRQSVRNKKVMVQAKLGDGQKADAGWVNITLQIRGFVLRPLLGTIQSRLLFSEKRMSQKLVLDTNIRRARQLWRQAIQGAGKSLLHDRGIYDVEKIWVGFYDMLGLVSLPVTVPHIQQLYTLPISQGEQTVKAYPNATEEQTHRIEIPKRVEGEYVNYKEFETGDNIQRIVWKIYAKSGQLVVRIPEIKDPYASHLYFYVSFFNNLSPVNGAFETELLNVFKDHVRNLLEALQRNGYDVRVPHDQEVLHLAGKSERKNELFQIATACWQQQKNPVSFVSPSKAAFVCLSSLTSAAEIEVLLKNLPQAVPLVVVKLSEAIASPFRFTFKDIFFKPEPQPADNLKQPWFISSLRSELIKNEKAIELLLNTRGNSWLTKSLLFQK